MKLGSLRRKAIEHLARAGMEDGRLQVDWLIEHVLGLTPARILIESDRDLSADEEGEILDSVRRRLAGEPLQYIVGWTEFFGLRISVRPGVLIPRPETEIVVEEVLRITTDNVRSRILDAGTGSGCIALAVKSRRPDATVVACDVSEVAIAVAMANAVRLRLQVDFMLADVESAESLKARMDACDVIVSNPPYIPTSETSTLAREVRDHEPHEALFAGSDPLRYYRAVMDRANEIVVEGGAVVFEVHVDYAGAVTELAEEKGLRNVRVRRDLAGLPRVVTAFR